jgi:hypothetical protein
MHDRKERRRNRQGGKGEEGRGRCNFGSCKLNSNVGLQELQSQYIVSMQKCTRTHPQQYAIFKKILEQKHPNPYSTRVAASNAAREGRV